MKRSSNSNLKKWIGGGVIALLIGGLAVAYVLVRQNQDLASQAALKSANPYCNLKCQTNANCFNQQLTCLKKKGEDKGVCRLRTNPDDAACRTFNCQVDGQGNPVCPEFAQVMCPPGQETVPQPENACGCAVPPLCVESEDGEISVINPPWHTSPEPSRSVSYEDINGVFIIDSKITASPFLYQILPLAQFHGLSADVTSGKGEVGIQLQFETTKVQLKTWIDDGARRSTNLSLRLIEGSSGSDIALIKKGFTLPLRLSLESNLDNTISGYYVEGRTRKFLGKTKQLPVGNYQVGMFTYGNGGSAGTFDKLMITAAQN